jgi:arylsulfatase A-like enzyme
MRFISLLSCLLIAFFAHAQKTLPDTLITQNFTYKTDKAGEMYFLWAVDNWKGPADSKYLPEGTFLKKKMAWTKMISDSGRFTLKLSLPKNTMVNYMFWVPLDKNKDSTDGWDTYGEIFYSSLFSEKRNILIDDHALYLPSDDAWNAFALAKYILLSLVILSIVLIILFRKKLSFSKTGFFAGLLLGSAILMILERMYMNQLFVHPSHVFGAALQDLLWLALVGAFFFILLYSTRKYRWTNNVIFIVFLICAILFSLISILNIEIVKHLGRPLTYQWLYYADFMKGSEAKNAMAYNIAHGLILNISLLLIPGLLIATGFAFIPARAMKKTNYVLLSALVILLVAGLIQVKTIPYNSGKIRNPFMELISSAITAGQSPELFSMKISGSDKIYIEQFHQPTLTPRPDSASLISNIILFVMESTPRDLVGIYDSSIEVTPNLIKYKSVSTAYYNMYAHIPSTPNSMLSLVNGIYPLITYKSFLNEYTYSSLPALPAELKDHGWRTSFFSSSDLSFSNMRSFAQKTGFQAVEDNRVINCSLKAFHTTNTPLDGLNDQCIVDRYFQWVDQNKMEHKYSMMWTNQTHYPYFFDADKEVIYVNNNKDLNHYLNALKSSDEAFGMLMKGLEERGMLRNTMVIVIGDHGEAFGTHNQSTHASHIYEENVHIPCIIYSPLLCKGDTSNKICELIDIVPTISGIAGLSQAPEWQGRSLFSHSQHDRAFFFCPYSDLLFGCRSGKWKYIYNAIHNEDELYDLVDDPKELKNVSSLHPDIAKKEHELIAAWVQYHKGKLSQWEKENKIR